MRVTISFDGNKLSTVGLFPVFLHGFPQIPQSDFCFTILQYTGLWWLFKNTEKLVGPGYMFIGIWPIALIAIALHSLLQKPFYKWRINQALSKMPHQNFQFHISLQGIRAVTAFSDIFYPWSAIYKVEIFPDVWEICFGRKACWFIPTDELNEEARLYLEARLKENGISLEEVRTSVSKKSQKRS